MEIHFENEDKFKLELNKKIEKQHVLGCWVAIAVNTIWSVISYLFFFDGDTLYLFAGIAISVIVFCSIMLRKQWKISSEMLGMIPMALMGIYFSLAYSQLELEKFQQFTYIYVSMFLGAGMFLLWNIKYSIYTVISIFIASVIFINLLSPLSFVDAMLNGGILDSSMALFMIVSIQVRYNYISKKIKSNIVLMETQKKIKISEVQNRLLFNQNPRPMIIYNLENLDILDVNETMVNKYGYTRAEFLGMKITQLRREEDIDKLLKDVEDIKDIKNGIEKVSEFVHVLKNGEKIFVEISAKSIDYSGKKARLVLINDITQSKIIQDQIIDSEKEHRLFFENNPVPMFVFSEKHQRIIEVNKTMESRYGYDSEEFSKLQLNNEPLYDTICELFTNDFSIEKEYSHISKAGNIIIVKAKKANIKYKRKPAILVSLNDITKIKYNELALRDARRHAEEAKELQSQFLSQMSHEIRTPMNGILGMTRLLKKTKLTQEQEKYANATFVSAKNLLHIINEILDFSKIEAGKMTIEKIPFNLKELANVWEESLILIADEKEIGFNINIKPDVPNNLVGDPVRLNQVIFNLAGNAIKFTKDGDVSINIFVDQINQNDVLLRFDVKDNGIGIPINKQVTIFDSFSQASTSTTRQFGGTGLGLAITKQLIELQNGEIWVESEEGVGSTFTFVINYELQNEEVQLKKPVVEKESEDKLEALNVLLVEDHEINQMLATTVLEGWSFKVDLAENGEEAVQKVAKENYDVILMDIHMPKMDGYDATIQIRNKLSNQTPIIAMTASALIGDNQKCFDVGMDDYVSKPFDPDVLLQKIKKQLTKKSV